MQSSGIIKKKSRFQSTYNNQIIKSNQNLKTWGDRSFHFIPFSFSSSSRVFLRHSQRSRSLTVNPISHCFQLTFPKNSQQWRKLANGPVSQVAPGTTPGPHPSPECQASSALRTSPLKPPLNALLRSWLPNLPPTTTMTMTMTPIWTSDSIRRFLSPFPDLRLSGPTALQKLDLELLLR